MEKKLFISLMLIIWSVGLWSQKKSDFNIIIPDVKVENSVYSGLQYIESRPEPGDMGALHTDMWNGFQAITLNIPLEEQLKPIMDLATSRSGDKTLAVQIRALFFESGTKKTKGDNAARVRMTLYKMDGETYYFLNTLDTVLLDSNAGKIKVMASHVITSFIIENLPYDTTSGEQALDLQQVADIDMYEKNSIPFFMETNIPDGIYYKYRSLKNLTPDEVPDINITKQDDDKVKEAKIPDPEKPGKEKKLKANEIYAFVANGVPHISFEGDFYKASFKDGFWSFKKSRKTGGGFMLGIGFGGGNRSFGGGVGFGIPVGGRKEDVEIFIDHLNGDLY